MVDGRLPCSLSAARFSCVRCCSQRPARPPRCGRMAGRFVHRRQPRSRVTRRRRARRPSHHAARGAIRSASQNDPRGTVGSPRRGRPPIRAGRIPAMSRLDSARRGTSAGVYRALFRRNPVPCRHDASWSVGQHPVIPYNTGRTSSALTRLSPPRPRRRLPGGARARRAIGRRASRTPGPDGPRRSSGSGRAAPRPLDW